MYLQSVIFEQLNYRRQTNNIPKSNNMEGSSGSETTRNRKLNIFDKMNNSDAGEAEIHEARDLEKERRDINKATNTNNMDWSSCGRLLRMVIYVMVVAAGIGATYAYVPWKISLAVICLLIFLLGFYLGLIYMMVTTIP